MTPFNKLIYADADTTTLSMANDLIWQHKLNMLPLVDKNHVYATWYLEKIIQIIKNMH